MLAAHLHKLTRSRPVRYALDPAHLQAIQNYLKMQTRARDIPFLHTAAANVGALPLNALQDHPTALAAFNELLRTGHPGDLMAHLDMMNDAGYPRPTTPGMHHDNLHDYPVHDQILYHLHDLLNMVHGPRENVMGWRDEAYHAPGAVEGLRRSLLQPATYTGRTPIFDVLRNFSHGTRFKEPSERVGRTVESVLRGSYQDIPDLYDQAHQQESDPYEYSDGGPLPGQRSLASLVRGIARHLLGGRPPTR